MTTTNVQKAQLETAGSLVNFILGNNATAPVIGAGATILHYTDRHAYEVLDVSLCGKYCKIQRYAPKRVPNTQAESQEYVYDELTGKAIELVWRRGAWRRKYETVEFEPAFLADYDSAPQTHERWCEYFVPLRNEDGSYKVIEGKTFLKVNYDKINIIFGTRQEYYDYSF